MKNHQIELRPPGEHDIAFIHRVYSDWNVARFLNRIPFPYELSDAEATVARMKSDNENSRNRNWIIIERETDERCGIIVLNERSARRAVLGFSVAPESQGHGIASQASRMMIKFAFSAGYEEIQASPIQENIASQKVLRKLGFDIEEAGIEEGSLHSATCIADRWILKRPQQIGDGNAMKPRRQSVSH